MARKRIVTQVNMFLNLFWGGIRYAKEIIPGTDKLDFSVTANSMYIAVI